MQNPALEKEILECTAYKFNDLALKIFQYQAMHAGVYSQWLKHCSIQPESIVRFEDIPYMPISLFKTQKVLVSGEHTGRYEVFESSSTTGSGISRHFVPFPQWYVNVFSKCFEIFYGEPKRWRIFALLPSYLERSNSSLVYMADKLISNGYEGGGFFQTNFSDLQDAIAQSEEENVKTILLGVSYALLDFSDYYQGPGLRNTIVMETGGMKGRRAKMTREEMHQHLCTKLGVNEIHSEYGMTELMSQAYSSGSGLFQTPPWMKVSAFEINDPFRKFDSQKTGRLCVADLANLYSCSFLATDDLAKVYSDGDFQVVGRFDFSDTRGCNLMWS